MKEEYTKKQINKAKLLASILFPNCLDDSSFRVSTNYGVKTNTGVINVILTIMYDKE